MEDLIDEQASNQIPTPRRRIYRPHRPGRPHRPPYRPPHRPPYRPPPRRYGRPHRGAVVHHGGAGMGPMGIGLLIAGGVIILILIILVAIFLCCAYVCVAIKECCDKCCHRTPPPAHERVEVPKPTEAHQLEGGQRVV